MRKSNYRAKDQKKSSIGGAIVKKESRSCMFIRWVKGGTFGRNKKAPTTFKISYSNRLKTEGLILQSLRNTTKQLFLQVKHMKRLLWLEGKGGSQQGGGGQWKLHTMFNGDRSAPQRGFAEKKQTSLKGRPGETEERQALLKHIGTEN